MERFEIENLLSEKYDDNYTIKMFTNFVLEFQECFSNIMSTEVLIDRIKKNVFGNIVIKDEFNNKRLDGQYAADGYIYLKKSAVENERYVKYLLFHELLHALTSIRDENGNEIMVGFSYLKNCYGTGLNEAMTEYLTQIRNEKFEENYSDLISGYRTVVEQIRRLTLIIGDEELKKCYFYNPASLKELLNSKNINYDEIELAYRNLYGKDGEVYAIENGRKLSNNRNYNLSKYAEMIFNNYANAIGEITKLEDFKAKYEIFETYVDGECDCIGIMLLAYYKNMGNDVGKLLKRGVSFDEIKEVLQVLKIDVNTLTSVYNISKCFVDDKNQSAIRLYEYYQKNPDSYFKFFRHNYGMVLDHFSECDVTPANNALYDAVRYPLIGLLLKEHPEIDYSDVSCDYIEEKNLGINIFIFSSSTGKKYAYTAKGEKVLQRKDENGNEIFKFKVNDKCNCSFIYQKDGKKTYSLSAKNDFDLDEFNKKVVFNTKHYYSVKEDFEYWIANGEDENGDLAKKLNSILKRIQERRKDEINLDDSHI